MGDVYTYVWIGWLLAFVGIEAAALLRKDRGDTLSEHVWDWFDVDKEPKGWTLRRIVLGGFMAWLTSHFVFGI